MDPTDRAIKGFYCMSMFPLKNLAHKGLSSLIDIVSLVSFFMIGQHWSRWWLGAVWHQAIMWTNVDNDLWYHTPSLGMISEKRYLNTEKNILNVIKDIHMGHY